MQIDSNIWNAIASNRPDEKLNPMKNELIDNLLMPNHQEMVNIIETKFYLGATSMDDRLRQWFLDYIDHVATYRALRNAASKDPTLSDLTPARFGRPFPGNPGEDSQHPCPQDTPKGENCFVEAIRAQARNLQKSYDGHAKTLFKHISGW
jgi:hypothetical protein